MSQFSAFPQDPTTAEDMRLAIGGLKRRGERGALYRVTSSQTAAYTAKIGEFVLADPSGGGFTITLPTAVGADGHEVIVKNGTGSTNTITIDGSGAETIDGSATTTITTARGSVRVVSDGSGWHTV